MAANVPIYLFSIQYLGIHWISDVVPGVFLAIICALFSHRIQPILRSIPENGWKSALPQKEVANLSIAFAVIGTAILGLVVIDGPGTEEGKPTTRMGPGDVNLEVIEVHTFWDPARVSVVNVGEEPLEVLIIHRDEVEEHANGGVIEWGSLPLSGNAVTLGAGDSLEKEVMTPSIFDGHFVILSHQGKDGVGEARVTIEYVDDELIFSALAMSAVSFAIMGWVVGGALRFIGSNSQRSHLRIAQMPPLGPAKSQFETEGSSASRRISTGISTTEPRLSSKGKGMLGESSQTEERQLLQMPARIDCLSPGGRSERARSSESSPEGG